MTQEERDTDAEAIARRREEATPLTVDVNLVADVRTGELRTASEVAAECEAVRERYAPTRVVVRAQWCVERREGPDGTF